MSLLYRNFLDLLEATPRDWFLTPGGAIRRTTTKTGPLLHECPICSLHPKFVWLYDVAAVAIGLNQGLAYAIADAADKVDGHDESIRADLLDACGLPRDDDSIDRQGELQQERKLAG